MINILNLLWIVPLAGSIGFVAATIFCITKEGK